MSTSSYNYHEMSTLRKGEVFRDACEELEWLACGPTEFFAQRALVESGAKMFPGDLIATLLEATRYQRDEQIRDFIGPIALEHAS